MRVEDFGRMDGPVVLFGGPYSNLQALQAMGQVIGESDAICTGDIVAYGASPAETISQFRAMAVPCVAGNCERQIADGADDCGCGFDEGSACNILSKGWYPYALSQCDSDAANWLGELPEIGVFTHQNRRYAVIHGGATAINRFIWPSSPDTVFLEEITALAPLTGKIDGIVSGHSGIAFHRRIDGYQWINAGVIGLPPHDARPETRYAVLDDGEVTIHRLSYDFAEARRAMESAGLTQGYQETLETGIWPSEDVLPSALRR
jgi:predicted phosphodiesterase